MKKAIFPGSFDPITLGHVDIINRGATLFDEIIIAIGENSSKDYMFSIDERVAFIESAFKDNPKVRVMNYSGLTIDFCKEIEVDFIMRGLRNPADFEFEKAIAHTNRHLSTLETVFLLTSSQTSFISSSIVREIIRYEGDYKKLVPNSVRV
ncbi:MAG: pantetheine-phosphate adenylyltransferase [Flavobacteriales bacterium]|jgi:pantetheine-phosphate adenylyltransferase|tara:strand:+ start:296 stop:748 length:453 start_codon:yes stop_codon:yes gene_type:complete